MRATLISMLAVALLAAGICIFSVGFIERAVVEMDALRAEVLDLTDAGQIETAHLTLQQMTEKWKRQEELLAIFAPHDALHEITALLIESAANLTADDPDDFSRSMALLGEALRHLHADERLTLSNILAIC